jgi:hypothetical protein
VHGWAFQLWVTWSEDSQQVLLAMITTIGVDKANLTRDDFDFFA